MRLETTGALGFFEDSGTTKKNEKTKWIADPKIRRNQKQWWSSTNYTASWQKHGVAHYQQLASKMRNSWVSVSECRPPFLVMMKTLFSSRWYETLKSVWKQTIIRCYNNNNNNNNTLSTQCLWCCHHDSESLQEFIWFTRWMQNSAKPPYLSHWPACRLLGNHIYHRQKADTHFILPSHRG